MGRRCKKCEKPQIDKSSTLCPICEIEAVVPSNETDAEFAELFEEYHGAEQRDNLDGDIFRQRERLNRLVSTEENKLELEHLENIQQLIEKKKEKLKNKLLVQAISADINKKLIQKFYPPSPLASPKSTSLSIKCEENCTSPSNDTFDHNSNVIIAKPPLSPVVQVGLGKTPEIKKEVMDFDENVTDEIDGNCIFNKVVQEDETAEDEEPVLRKVVRRRSSVKDRIKAFEMLSKR